VSDDPLPELVSRVAFEAAFRDPRFPPLSAAELSGLQVEVSVLSPPRRIPSPELIIVGRHGVLLRKSGRSAVFLPSVAAEQGWDRVELLDNLCAKAGLAGRCWADGAELEVFEAEVFGGASDR
jgi:AmmeMemoRadiSam system protein A